MPLIIVTGLPSSGKSTTAQAISDYLCKRLKDEKDPRRVRIVTDGDSLDWDGRDSIYMSIPKEKELRGWLRAEASRYANLNQVVILDAAAYIKGFRYELHCLAREAKTHYCVVELNIDPEVCWERNQNRITQSSRETDPDAPEPGYNRETFDALLLRYEKCDENNRWDSPLFELTKPNRIGEETMEKVYQAVTTSEPLVPNKSTTQLMSSTTIYRPPK